MGSVLHGEVVPLDNASKALTFGLACDVNHLTNFEALNSQRIAYCEGFFSITTKLQKLTSSIHICLAEMASFGLIDLGGLNGTKGHLNGFIAIGLSGLTLHDPIRRCFNNRHRN